MSPWLDALEKLFAAVQSPLIVHTLYFEFVDVRAWPEFVMTRRVEVSPPHCSHGCSCLQVLTTSAHRSSIPQPLWVDSTSLVLPVDVRVQDPLVPDERHHANGGKAQGVHASVDMPRANTMLLCSCARR